MTRRPGALLLCLALSLTSCDKSLEVTGVTQRVVGQTVTFQLTQGEPTFEKDLWLRAADNFTYETRDLKVTRKDDRTLSFVIPAEIAVGAAEAMAWAGGGVYRVPLEINRLALTVDDRGTLEGWPLPPGSLTRPSRSFAAGAAQVAVTPSGGELVLAIGGQLLILEIGNELKDVTAGIKLPGVIALGAVPGGALAVTDTTLYLVRFVKGGAITQISLQLPNAQLRAVAANLTGDRALLLHTCDTNSDNQADSDCLTEIAIGAELIRERQVVLDGIPSAVGIGATRDARGAVVGDTDGIHGVWFEAPPALPRLSKVAWVIKQAGKDLPFTGQPVGIDRAATVVKSSPTEVRNVDLFAVAEKSKNAISFVAFNPVANNDLQKTSEAILAEPPMAIGFGRRTELVVAAGRSLYTLDAGQSNPAAKKLAAQTAGNIVAFTVQP